MPHDLARAIDRPREARRRCPDGVALHLQLGLDELRRRRDKADGHASRAACKRMSRKAQIDRRRCRRAAGGIRIGARLVSLEEWPTAKEHAVRVHADGSVVAKYSWTYEPISHESEIAHPTAGAPAPLYTERHPSLIIMDRTTSIGPV